MFINNFDPIAIEIFSFELRWYSLAYIFGILLAWGYCKKILIKDQKILSLFDDFITYIIIGIILGGRVGYIVFYNLDYYIHNLSEMFKLWNGGMSFHGGLVGTIIMTVIFSKKHKINSYKLLDLISLTAPIGLFLGRLANFINAELYGRATDVFWSVKFISVDQISRHPSQIYEALLEGITLFIILNYIYKKNAYLKDGFISSLFLIFYSIFRFVVEFFREPDAQVGYFFYTLTMGQLISIMFFIAGIIIYSHKKNDD